MVAYVDWNYVEVTQLKMHFVARRNSPCDKSPHEIIPMCQNLHLIGQLCATKVVK